MRLLDTNVIVDALDKSQAHHQWAKKQIEDAVWEQPRGYVTDPIRLAQGFEIFKVEEHHKAGLAAFEEVETLKAWMPYGIKPS